MFYSCRISNNSLCKTHAVFSIEHVIEIRHKFYAPFLEVKFFHKDYNGSLKSYHFFFMTSVAKIPCAALSGI